MISSHLLESFLVFGEQLNFTRAAEALHISQPALHVQIRKLTDELGVDLYRRSGRSLHLTPAGSQVLAFARETRGRAEQFRGELDGSLVQRPVTLAAGEGAFLYMLGPAIRRFRRGSSAALRLLTRNAAGTVAAVRDGDADLGVAVLDGPEDGLVAERLVSAGSQLIVPKGHRLARRRSVRFRELEGEPMVVPPVGRPLRAAIGRRFLQAGISWGPVVEANGWPLMMHFVKLGVGLAVVNDVCSVPTGLGVARLPELPAVPYYLLTRARGFRSTTAERLAELVHEAAENIG